MARKKTEVEHEKPRLGRDPIYDESMKQRNLRMTDEHWLKCLRLGGSAWVRERIERAKEPKS